MTRAGSLALKRQIALEWAANWQAEHAETVLAASRALGAGQFEQAGRLLGQLTAIIDKASAGLLSVVDALSDEDAL